MKSNSKDIIIASSALIVKKSKIKPVVLARMGFNVPQIFTNLETIEIQEFAFVNKTRTRYVLIRNFDLGIFDKTNHKYIHRLSVRQPADKHINKTFFTLQDIKKGVPLNKVIEANKKLIQLSIDGCYEKLQKQSQQELELLLK
ncbi:MAG: hypothetical protein IJ975_00400 [Clostridia bacterium]|nr:hypothetical protein [Clostridia bacterium]